MLVIYQEIQQLCEKIASSRTLDQEEMSHYWTALNELQANDQIAISSLDYQGVYNANECIRIRIQGSMIWDISHWKLTTGSLNQVYIFPADTVIYGDNLIAIYTQPGSEYSFLSKHPIWNNRGDTATLLNAKGKVMSSWVYGSDAHPHVVIGNLVCDEQEPDSERDGYVELMNQSSHIVDIGLWEINVLPGHHRFTFPPNATIAPFGTVRIYALWDFPQAENAFSFNSRKPIWNKQGGSCELSDVGRNVIVSTYTW